MADRDPALAAVHRQAEKPGVADPNSYARWHMQGGDLALRRVPVNFDLAAKLKKLCEAARKAGATDGFIASTLRAEVKVLEGEVAIPNLDPESA